MNVSERLFHRNPEILKSIWLELSLSRLIAIPVFLLLIYFGSYSVSVLTAGQFSFAISAYQTFVFIVLYIYGTWSTAQSYLNEVNDNTWNFQRMSSIEPWRMTIGKLFGGPLYAWYGGLLGSVAYLGAVAAAPVEAQTKASAETPLFSILLILTMAVMAHALTLLTAMQLAERNAGKSRTNAFFGIFVGGLAWGALAIAFREKQTSWWGESYPNIQVQTWAIVVFTLISVFGVHSRMKRELQQGSVPWVFPVFLIALWVYLTGVFMTPASELRRAMEVATFILAALTLLMAALELNDLGKWRYVRSCLKKSQWNRALRQLPAWPVGFLVFSVFAAFGTILGFGDGVSVVKTSYPKLWFFLVRDISVVIWIMAAFNRRHADLMMIFAGLFLYLFFPMIVGGFSQKGMGAGFALPMVISGSAQFPSLIFGALQAAAAVGFTFYYLKRRSSKAGSVSPN